MNTPATTRRRMPRGFRKGHGGDIACPHRDVSCCPSCASAHVEIVDVCGQHFWVADTIEREKLVAEIAAMRARYDGASS